ncbi:hypothetical protein SAMN04487950_0713 [Halogranum rubrum]|uniref:Uncharacterized protein n=1 Tax=Halogranum rubrum TaxID=553466 RepID=A0A1I4BRV1_9EURY|nr:hypothetical protein SAMN04487950_0713 [Halogranum rubrum]
MVATREHDSGSGNPPVYTPQREDSRTTKVAKEESKDSRMSVEKTKLPELLNNLCLPSGRDDIRPTARDFSPTYSHFFN